MINLCNAQSPGRTLIVYGTLKAQVPVLIATTPCTEGLDSCSICMPSVAGLLTVTAYGSQTGTIMSYRLFTSIIYTSRSSWLIYGHCSYIMPHSK